jgi:BlaI family penicillinase repressor
MKRISKTAKADARRAGGLTELETDIMQVLWEQREATAADVRKLLQPIRPLAPTTVITLLDRLSEKGVVAPVKGASRPKRYRAVLEPTTVANRLLSVLQRRFFGGSSASLFAHLLASGDVDERELEEIRKLLAAAHKRGD